MVRSNFAQCLDQDGFLPLWWAQTCQSKGHSEIDSIDDFSVPEKLEERQMVVKYQNARGENRCHGGKDLKQSQEYPRQLLISS